ncbi:MAG: DUF5372 family protein, partial [Inquilinus sp.]|uniref:DUF5372 family protein n=1 Tax=Inquilinus sp. TaxID=1932117 RepID=UPI003F2C10CE
MHYPFHPRHGETVVAVGAKRHAGAEHLIVRQPDHTLALLPRWMTEPEAALHRLIPSPRLPIARLADLRALVDTLLEHFSSFLNRGGFPKGENSDSRCRLVREASLHDATSFHGYPGAAGS